LILGFSSPLTPARGSSDRALGAHWGRSLGIIFYFQVKNAKFAVTPSGIWGRSSPEIEFGAFSLKIWHLYGTNFNFPESYWPPKQFLFHPTLTTLDKMRDPYFQNVGRHVISPDPPVATPVTNGCSALEQGCNCNPQFLALHFSLSRCSKK